MLALVFLSIRAKTILVRLSFVFSFCQICWSKSFIRRKCLRASDWVFLVSQAVLFVLIAIIHNATLCCLALNISYVPLIYYLFHWTHICHLIHWWKSVSCFSFNTIFSWNVVLFRYVFIILKPRTMFFVSLWTVSFRSCIHNSTRPWLLIIRCWVFSMYVLSLFYIFSCLYIIWLW